MQTYLLFPQIVALLKLYGLLLSVDVVDDPVDGSLGSVGPSKGLLGVWHRVGDGAGPGCVLRLQLHVVVGSQSTIRGGVSGAFAKHDLVQASEIFNVDVVAFDLRVLRCAILVLDDDF